MLKVIFPYYKMRAESQPYDEFLCGNQSTATLHVQLACLEAPGDYLALQSGPCIIYSRRHILIQIEIGNR